MMSKGKGWTGQGGDLVKGVSNHLAQSTFSREMKRDFHESIEYYLDKQQKAKLATLGKAKQSIFLTLWLFKILFLRLSLVRRTLFVFGVVFVFMGKGYYRGSPVFLGGLILVWLLLIELKDKLFAKEELAEGHAVQAALMPSSTPDVPGWSVWLYTAPANDVGGDLVDHICLGEGRHGIALGDVAGKGLSAALYMAKLQSTLRAVVTDMADLKELGEKVNRIFCRDTQANRFASMIYVELDESSSEIAWLNAGHLPPLVMRNGQLQEMDNGGAALGLSKEMTYQAQSLTLRKGEWAIFYSDGVTESCNEVGDFLGDERFKSLLREIPPGSSPQLGAHILDHLAKFIGQARLNDDISLAIIQPT